ncbi:uncharacterized protein [Fopius arisanus]|uniref:CUB domain-containing protein n=1 Tax=Fopius arisanus TaxID=64838 RepID=A0A9R1TY75_9HYME|nr:PREDICTED: uncharacterized protein LOC105264923 [Fopius arisanus]
MPDIQDAGCVPLGLLCLLLIIPLGNTSSPPGISLKSQKYAQKTLAEEDICHPVTGVAKNSMRLPRLPNSGLIISPAHVFDTWAYRVDDLRCKFVIKAPKGEHLFAVIQSMSFRRNESGCIDYVKFRRKDRNSTDKFCDNFDRRRRRYSLDHSEDYTGVMSKNASFTFGEFDLQGEIETTIFVSKETLSGGQRLDLTLVYTPYKDCEKVDDNQYRTMRYDVCIWREYFCDGYTNCFAGICMDEDYCPDEATSNGTGTTVTIGAVTTILLCFIIFLMGLCICKKNRKLCWSTDCAGPSSQDPRGRGDSGASTQTQGVAPMLEIAALPSPLDKDLPPSYDSLFPEQANRATS